MVLLVDPSDLVRSRIKPTPWVYADSDLSEQELVQAAMGNAPNAIPPEKVQEAATALRTEYVEWLDRALSLGAREHWLLSSIYRNPYRNDLFLHLTWMVLLQNWLATGGSVLTIFTASPGFARSVRDRCRAAGVPCRWVRPLRCRLRQGNRVVRTLLGSCVRAGSLLCRMALARLLLGKTYRNRLGGVRTVVSTFTHEADFASEGTFTDRYFKGLEEYYDSQGLTVAVFPRYADIPLRRFAWLYRRMREANRLFLPPELFLSTRDLIKGVGGCGRMIMSPSEGFKTFRGMPVHALARHDHFRLCIAMHAVLTGSEGWRRMFRAGVRPQDFVLWYENQPEDKAIVLGLGCCYPKPRVAAVRQFVAVPNLLSQFSTKGEVEAGICPSENWVCGPRQAEAFSAYDGRGSYHTVPALRFRHLHQTSEQGVGSEGTNIVVLLTFSIPESMNILRVVAEGVAHHPESVETVVVKPHPDLNLADVKRTAESRWSSCRAFTWHTGKVAEVFRAARIIVSAGSSSAVEASCVGLPVIIVGRPAGLDMNPMEGFDRRIWEVVYSAAGFCEIMRRWSPAHPLPLVERQRIGNEILKASFQVSDVDSMRTFLPRAAAPLRPSPLNCSQI